MKIINRTMTATVTNTTEYGTVQASINSDGRITLRTTAELDRDTIVVLSERETGAILDLFRRIKRLGMALPELPF